MKIIKPIVFGLVVIGIAAALAFSNAAGSRTPAPPVTQATDTSNKTYVKADIAKHPDVSSCWTIINGGVYDLTEWVGKHPGGRQAILSICGKDASAAFNAQHGDAQLQQEILKGYKIGTLSK